MLCVWAFQAAQALFGGNDNQLVPQPLLTIWQYGALQDKAPTCELSLFSLIV